MLDFKLFFAERTSLETFQKKSEELSMYFCQKIRDLIPLSYVSKQQSTFLAYSKENLIAGEFLVILDFSENYSFVVQNEVQGWYWNNSQCTIHPFVIYYKDNNNVLQHTSLIIISECLKHNFSAVRLFQQKLMTFLNTKFNAINKILFFSDGAGSQYKNKYNFYHLCQFQNLYGCSVEWHFFATSHGKGPCDGIGGTLKRLAAKASLQRTFDNQILTANQLYEWAISGQSAMNYEYCTIPDYDESDKYVKQHFKNVKVISGTQKFHAFILSSKNRLQNHVVF